MVYIEEIPHQKYQRLGNNLKYVHSIPLIDALCAAPFEIETLDHRKIIIPLDKIASPSASIEIPDEGMPIFEEETIEGLRRELKKGKLIIEFDVIFPKYIDPKNKIEIKQILN